MDLHLNDDQAARLLPAIAPEREEHPRAARPRRSRGMKAESMMTISDGGVQLMLSPRDINALRRALQMWHYTLVTDAIGQHVERVPGTREKTIALAEELGRKLEAAEHAYLRAVPPERRVPSALP
jgi:hypothetical protein